MRRVWTEDEINLLKKLHPSMSNNEIARQLNRSCDSIENKARKLGLRKSPEFKREMYEKLVEMGIEAKTKKELMKPWTTEEDVKLTRLCGKSFPSEIARQIGRSRSSVIVRLQKLGLSCNRFPQSARAREAERLAGHIMKKQGFKIIERGGNNKPFDYLVSINGEIFGVDVKNRTFHESPSTFMRFLKLPYKHAFLYIVSDRFFFMPVHEIKQG